MCNSIWIELLNPCLLLAPNQKNQFHSKKYKKVSWLIPKTLEPSTYIWMKITRMTTKLIFWNVSQTWWNSIFFQHQTSMLVQGPECMFASLIEASNVAVGGLQVNSILCSQYERTIQTKLSNYLVYGIMISRYYGMNWWMDIGYVFSGVNVQHLDDV